MPPTLGLRANLRQFSLLVAINALVGGMVGQERTVVPLLARDVFGLQALGSGLTFLVAFGLTKALANLLAGTLSDRVGRRPVLVAGWLVGLAVPALVIWAPSWEWVVAANVLLGINQGFTWSTTVIMKIDLVGPSRRGFAMGLNEASGYGAVAVTAYVTGLLAETYGLRPVPFLLGLAYAALGLAASAVFVRETRGHADLEATVEPRGDDLPPSGRSSSASAREIVLATTIREPALSAATQAGLVNNLNDALAWGLLPVYYAAGGASVVEIGFLAGVYPAVWGLGQLATGALSDRIGRKPLITAGMLLQAVALALIASTRGVPAWAVAAAVLGAGTAMVYPTLLAAIGDVAHPSWRASALGVYRFWRDLGFAVGAVLAALVADRFGIPAAIWLVAGITALSGLVVVVRMYETISAPRIRGGQERSVR